MAVTVLQLSDTHFGPTADQLVSGYHPEGRLAAVIDAWENTGETADLVLLTGDDADTGEPDAYARLVLALEAFEAPVLALTGNHDVVEEVVRAFGGAEIAEIGAWRIIGVNSSRPNEVHGTVDVGAVSELLDALDDRPTILAIHHPPRSRSTNPYFQLGHGETFLEALAARPHVKAVVSGHLHDAFEFEGPNGLALLGCPSTLMAIGHDGDRFSIGVAAPTGGRILRLADDGSFTTSLLIG
jgi:3',5'-cyclic-AMP phosphodiesterase